MESTANFEDSEWLAETPGAEGINTWQVYFLSIVDPTTPSRDFALVKVGITKNDVERRIEQLQTGNPYQIRCESSFRSPAARQVERWVHRTNASRIAQLEWLRLKRSEIPHLVETAKRESERLALIARSIAQWSHLESRGIERQASRDEERLHEAMTDVELDETILGHLGERTDEGERTNSLAELHKDFLILKQRETHLEVDRAEILAQAIQAIENCEAISGVCTFRRSLRPILDRKSFCAAYPNEAAQCSPGRKSYIRRRIYLSRSYLAPV